MHNSLDNTRRIYTVRMQEIPDEFIGWLQKDLTHFVSLVDEGSYAAGDPIQKGFSDRDLTIVVRRDIPNEIRAIRARLEDTRLENAYLFNVRLLDGFLHGDTLNDLSLKFRSKTILGEDVVSMKDAPSREAALKIGYEGLKALRVRCERRWLNLAHWSEKYSQSKNYEIFKLFFAYSAAKLYGETGTYPAIRADVAARLELRSIADDLLRVVNDIDNATIRDQDRALEGAMTIIDALPALS